MENKLDYIIERIKNIQKIFLSSLKNDDLKELTNKVFISSEERFNAT